jgi:hypothetical protein
MNCKSAVDGKTAPKSSSVIPVVPLPGHCLYVYWARWRNFDQPYSGRSGMVFATEHQVSDTKGLFLPRRRLAWTLLTSGAPQELLALRGRRTNCNEKNRGDNKAFQARRG